MKSNGNISEYTFGSTRQNFKKRHRRCWKEKVAERANSGYKLSLETISTMKQELSSAPLYAQPNEEQFPFLHVELFSIHNHLIQDPWETISVYFVDAHGNIQKSSYCLETGRPKPLSPVYRLPSISSRQSGDYNVSFKFLSEKFCLFCDGCNQILLFDTGDRSRTAEWKVVFKSDVSADQKKFIIRDARLDMVSGEKHVNLILHRIRSDKDNKDKGHISELLWYVISQDEAKVWTMKYKETFAGKGSIHYCALEPKSGAIVLSSNRPFKALSAVEEPASSAGDEEKEEAPADSKNNNFQWTQTDEDITIKFSCRADTYKYDYKVTYGKDKLQVKCKEDILVDSSLFSRVDTDLTTWTLENNFLQVTLIKEIPSLSWPFLVPDGPKENTDSQKDCDMSQGIPVSNLEAQIEECDDPPQSIEEDNYIDRLDLTTGVPTHRVLLGSRPPLFSTCIRPGFPAAIATRVDVDACLWLLHINPMKPEEWGFRHEGNLHAIGYVEASKQQKKFVNCSPDLNYTVICENQRHVFIYKSTYDSAAKLRNRNGPEVSIGKQHLVTLQDAGEVLGLAVDNSITIILTEKCIIYLQINVESL